MQQSADVSGPVLELIDDIRQILIDEKTEMKSALLDVKDSVLEQCNTSRPVRPGW